MPGMKEKVIKILNEFTYNPVDATDKLSDIGLDSLDMIEVVMEIEMELGVIMSDEQAEEFFANKTVQDLIDFVEKEA